MSAVMANVISYGFFFGAVLWALGGYGEKRKNWIFRVNLS